MAHQVWKPGTMIYPLPAVLVSCGGDENEYNLFTASWVGTICTDPAMCYVSIRPERFSHGIIKRNGAFVLNLTTERMARAVDWCGVRSGADFDKWKESGLTPVPAPSVKAPYIKESPLCIECRVKEILPLGSHDMFMANVANVLADESFIDPDTNRFMLERAGLIAYSHGHYYSLGKELGRFGWSVMKKKKKRQ
ncbi:MAG: flavin reductase family protein [Bacteroidetes bacterium]|uniref:Flavin reductase family protein n=1 Tax=Candidatus Caccoplasma merdipullorum TaxID=2840718 RepID=A0A9D9E1T8_9BACT|nr:flavin reductase family protein [Candidatus Caccoplasma merdipullorum]